MSKHRRHGAPATAGAGTRAGVERPLPTSGRHRAVRRRQPLLLAAAVTAASATAAATGVALAVTGASPSPLPGVARPDPVDPALSGASITAALDADRVLVQPLEKRVLLERSRSVSRSAERRATPARSQEPERPRRRAAAVRAPEPAREQAPAPAPTPAPAPPPPAWVLPVPSGYRLTAGFGECSALWSSCHTGLDFAAPSGTPIRAVAAGVVSEVAYAGPYGTRTIQTLPDGTEVWYCHQAATTVGAGTRVVAGQVIGSVGMTGNVTGPHLHLEVRPGGGDPVDPYAALAGHGLTP